MPVTPLTHMRIPLDLKARIDEAASREGVTRTAWVLDAARRRLRADAFIVTGQPVWDVRSPLDLPEGMSRDDELGEPFDPADPALWLMKPEHMAPTEVDHLDFFTAPE